MINVVKEHFDACDYHLARLMIVARRRLMEGGSE